MQTLNQAEGKLKRILYVCADASRTGAPTQLLRLIKGLHVQYDVSCACPAGWLADELKKINVPVLEMPEGFWWFVRRWLSKTYADLKPDIIHRHGIRSGVLGGLPIIPNGTKYVYTEHLWTSDFHLHSKLREALQLHFLKSVCKRSNVVVAVSHAVKSFLVNNLGVPEKKVKVIYGAIRSVTPVTNDSQTIGTMGRLTWVKGVDNLMRALPAIVKAFPEVKCRIAGDGPEREHLEPLAEQLKVSGHIEWLGAISDGEAFIHTLSVYVQPSSSESFGTAPVMALAAGVPVVASKRGALPEIIEDGVTGLLYDCSDTEALAKNVITLLSDADMRHKMGKRAAIAASIYTVERMAQAHDELYKGLLK